MNRPRPPDPRDLLARARDRRWSRRQWRQTNAALVAPPARAFAAYGDAVAIVPPARIETPDCISIGNHVLMNEHVWLCVQRRDGLPDPALVIGSQTLLSRFVKIVCLESVILEGNIAIGDRTYISDVEYLPGHADIDPQLRPLTEPRPVVLEHGVFLGIGVVVKPGVRIGSYAYVGANAMVTEDVPPRSLVVGSPARVVRQYDADADAWLPVT